MNDAMTIALIKSYIKKYSPGGTTSKEEMVDAVLSKLSRGLTLTDQTDGKNYRIFVSGGKLTMEEI